LEKAFGLKYTELNDKQLANFDDIIKQFHSESDKIEQEIKEKQKAQK